MDTQTRHALKHDRFVDATTSGIDWMAENRTNVIRAAIGVVLVVAIIVAAAVTYNVRKAHAQELFGEAMSIYETPLQQPGQPADPSQQTYASAAARAQAAHPLFAQIASQYGWIDVGANARYFSGVTDVDMGQTSAAEAELKKAASSHDHQLSDLAKVALANLYAQSGRTQQAVDTLQQVIKHPALTVPNLEAKLQLAQIYETTQPNEARRLYAEIKDQDKTTAAGQIATQRLQALK